MGNSPLSNAVSNSNDLIFVASVSSLTFTGTNTSTGTGVNTLAVAYSGNFSVASASSLTINAAITGGSGISLSKTGAGTLSLGAANSFAGSFTATAGTTSLVNGALGSVSSLSIASVATVSAATTGLTNVINDTAAVTLDGTLNLSGGTETIGSLAGSTAGATLTIGKSGTNSGGLTVGDSTSTTFAGVIGEASGTGTSTFTKQGTGKLTLTNTSTFAGTVNINAGTLVAANTGGAAALGSVTAINVKNGATLLFGATNQVNASAPVALGSATGSGTAVVNAATFSQGSATSAGLGALTLKATASLDFGVGSTATTLHFADSSGTAWTTGAVLSIADYAGIVVDQNQTPVGLGTNNDGLLFGSVTTTNLTSGQLAQIQFVNPVGADGTQYTGTFGAAISANGQVFAVVPEPATCLGGILLIGAFGWNQRRRLSGLAELLSNACVA